MKILKKEELNEYLEKYYQERFGKRNSDIWHEQPTVNVWVFERDGNFITLKSHILTGKVEEYIEVSQQGENNRK